MPRSHIVSLDAATAADAVLLANLLELYIHDLSAAFPDVVMGPDGRFGYSGLPRYWSEPERRFAFLIRADAAIAGFALVVRGSPASPDPATLDVAEFFVLRRYRRTGVGRDAAALLWRRLPGPWTVRVAERNPGGMAFWQRVFADGLAAGRVRAEGGAPTAWRVYAFDSTSIPAPADDSPRTAGAP